MDERTNDPTIGRLLDRRYRIGARIASGGMASVYEATDVRLERTVAVKIMHPGMGDDEEFAARFVREARHAARLSHPNVVGVHDQGEDDGTVYLAMELVAGHTLRDVIRKEAPMEPKKALALIEPVLSALSAAHRAHLIHRDIKPENVLIATDPHSGASQVKVADFGLAKAISADTQHTATGGVLIGTVSYLAPELVIDGRADTRADVYAAGVVLFELLTGRKPHEGESPIQVAYKHVHEDVPPPSRLVPGIPAYVDALVARATARDRGHRPADAGVMLHQVHRVASALADGIVDDPELVDDLAPPAARDVEEEQFREDTAPDPLAVPPDLTEPPVTEAEDVAQAPSPTTTIDRHAVVASSGAGAMAAGSASRQDAPPDDEWEPVPGGGARSPRASRLQAVMLGVLALLMAVTLGFGHWWFAPLTTAASRYTDTPNVIGETQDSATEEIEGAGLDVAVGEAEFSNEFDKGQVIRTEPANGDKVLDDGTVTLILSKGVETYEIPKVRRKSEDDAQALITEHFEYGKTIERYHPKIPEGQAITTNPKPGQVRPPTTTVDLVVSKGPKPITLRDWTGKDADKAKAWLENRDLEVTTTEEFNDGVAKGRVISQTPSTGELFKGDDVTLVISKGPELVEVPRVTGMGQEAAITTLEDAGFKVNVERHDNYLGIGYVFSSSPSRGEEAPKGSTVTITII